MNAAGAGPEPLDRVVQVGDLRRVAAQQILELGDGECPVVVRHGVVHELRKVVEAPLVQAGEVSAIAVLESEFSHGMRALSVSWARCGEAHGDGALDGRHDEGRQSGRPVGIGSVRRQRLGQQPLPVLERLGGGDQDQWDPVGRGLLDIARALGASEVPYVGPNPTHREIARSGKVDPARFVSHVLDWERLPEALPEKHLEPVFVRADDRALGSRRQVRPPGELRKVSSVG